LPRNDLTMKFASFLILAAAALNLSGTVQAKSETLEPIAENVVSGVYSPTPALDNPALRLSADRRPKRASPKLSSLKCLQRSEASSALYDPERLPLSHPALRLVERRHRSRPRNLNSPVYAEMARALFDGRLHGTRRQWHNK
jgi:hypothetical protein